ILPELIDHILMLRPSLTSAPDSTVWTQTKNDLRSPSHSTTSGYHFQHLSLDLLGPLYLARNGKAFNRSYQSQSARKLPLACSLTQQQIPLFTINTQRGTKNTKSLASPGSAPPLIQPRYLEAPPFKARWLLFSWRRHLR
ncbi:hypothetical protein HID58_072876, partial [Brassica napus]